MLVLGLLEGEDVNGLDVVGWLVPMGCDPQATKEPRNTVAEANAINRFELRMTNSCQSDLPVVR